MKKSIHTMKPNVHSKTLKSDILDQSFEIEITTKARKCIMKAGSLDKYLLTTDIKDLDSNFALHLRKLIHEKQRDPDMVIPYIPGSATVPRTRKTKVWEYK